MSGSLGGFVGKVALEVLKGTAKGAYLLSKYGGKTVKEATNLSIKATAAGLKKGFGG